MMSLNEFNLGACGYRFLLDHTGLASLPKHLVLSTAPACSAKQSYVGKEVSLTVCFWFSKFQT